MNNCGWNPRFNQQHCSTLKGLNDSLLRIKPLRGLEILDIVFHRFYRWLFKFYPFGIIKLLFRVDSLPKKVTNTCHALSENASLKKRRLRSSSKCLFYCLDYLTFKFYVLLLAIDALSCPPRHVGFTSSKACGLWCFALHFIHVYYR